MEQAEASVSKNLQKLYQSALTFALTISQAMNVCAVKFIVFKQTQLNIVYKSINRPLKKFTAMPMPNEVF